MTLRSSTERHGDFSSESVVSHLVSWVSSCVVCFVFWFCFGFWLCCLGLFWRTRGNSQTKTIRFDDRLSLERARHEHKKKFALTRPHSHSQSPKKQPAHLYVRRAIECHHSHASLSQKSTLKGCSPGMPMPSMGIIVPVLPQST